MVFIANSAEVRYKYIPPCSATVHWLNFVANCSWLWRLFEESEKLVKVCWTSPKFCGRWQILVDYSELLKSAKVRWSPLKNDFLTGTVELWPDSGGLWRLADCVGVRQKRKSARRLKLLQSMQMHFISNKSAYTFTSRYHFNTHWDMHILITTWYQGAGKHLASSQQWCEPEGEHCNEPKDE